MSYKPLKITLCETSGVLFSLNAMRLPKGSFSDTTVSAPGEIVIGEDDKRLAGNLIRAGADHAKFQRGIRAHLLIDMQVGFMIEFETYRHGVECLSTSSAMHNELVKLKGAELAEAKQAGLAEKVYTRAVDISYQALRSMYRARRSHRHSDWQLFCDFIETLPFFHELIMPVRTK